MTVRVAIYSFFQLPSDRPTSACKLGSASLQGIAEFFSACGEVKAVRLAGPLGSKKAWVEFGTKESARSAREYDNTVCHLHP